MPTIFLLDISASLLHPVSSADSSFTRQDLLQSGVLHFLKRLEPTEEVCIASFASESSIIVPFTTDQAELMKGLYDLNVEESCERAALSAGLGLMTELIRQRDGETTQVIIATDGRTDSVMSPIQASLNGRVRVHVMAIGSRQSVEHDMLKHLAQRNAGSFELVELPHEAKHVKPAFERLALQHYSAYSATLMLGHLAVPIKLDPDPMLHLADVYHPTTMLKLTMPSVLSIIGFLKINQIRCAPVISRHTLSILSVPAASRSTTNTGAAATAVSAPSVVGASAMLSSPPPRIGGNGTCLGSANTSPLTLSSSSSNMPPSTATDYHDQVLWLEILVCELVEEGLVALVLLADGWLAMLSGCLEHSIGGESAELQAAVLSILAPSFKRPHDEMMMPTVLPVLAVSKQHARSYKKCKTQHGVLQSEQLKGDVQRLQRRIKGLPSDSRRVFSECENLRKMSLRYMMPSIVDQLESLVRNEYDSRLVSATASHEAESDDDTHDTDHQAVRSLGYLIEEIKRSRQDGDSIQPPDEDDLPQSGEREPRDVTPSARPAEKKMGMENLLN